MIHSLPEQVWSEGEEKFFGRGIVRIALEEPQNTVKIPTANVSRLFALGSI